MRLHGAFVSRARRTVGPLSMLMLSLWVQTAAAQTVQITDDRGIAITLARTPQRVVSLLPSLTESVCALGQCQRLVGVDRYSNFPTSVQALPQLGGGLDPQVEAIVALKPDVVLLARSARVIERLQSLGLAVVALEPQTHSDVERVMRQLGHLLGVADAPRVWREIDAQMQAASQSLPEHLRGSRVYFEVDSAPYAAGEASFIGQTLQRLGLRNIVPLALGAFPKLNPEFIVRADPDVIMLGEGSRIGLLQRPGWASMRALRDGHLCVYARERADMLVRPGPRMAEAARLMVQCVVDVSNSVGKRPNDPASATRP